MEVVENELKMSSWSRKHVLALGNACRGLGNDLKQVITCADTQKEHF